MDCIECADLEERQHVFGSGHLVIVLWCKHYGTPCKNVFKMCEEIKDEEEEKARRKNK